MEETKEFKKTKVFIALPTHDGKLNVQTALALTAGVMLPQCSKYSFMFHAVMGCPYITKARNDCVRRFLESDCEEFIFVDSDIKFPSWGLYDLLSHDVDVVAGVYPKKKDEVEWPVMLKHAENGDITFGPPDKDGNSLLEAIGLPTGFMRIKRHVFEDMIKAYPEIMYLDPSTQEKTWDFFGELLVNGVKQWDDYAFCTRWTNMGGRLWVAANMEFSHFGGKEYVNNFWSHIVSLQEEANKGEARFSDGTKGELIVSSPQQTLN